MTIKEAYVSFETAKLLKEKKFNEPLLTFYVTDGKEYSFDIMAFTDDKLKNESECFILAPTLQMVCSWLRLVHHIHIESLCPVVDTDVKDGVGVTYNVVISNLRNQCLAFDTNIEDIEYNSYEEAIEAGILYTLKNLI